jgi:hypothetical protein
VRHPLRVAVDVIAYRPRQPKLSALAPAALRLTRERRGGRVRVHVVGGDEVRMTARRLARLAGRPLDDPRR